MKPFLLSLLCITFTLAANAQAPAIEWQNTIGGSGEDRLPVIRQTTDGGYILGGGTTSGVSGDKTEANWDTTETTEDIWVIKLDAAGNIVWQNTIGGRSDDFFHDLQQTADGGYILGCSSRSGISGDKTEASRANSMDYWVIKLDTAGNIVWQNTIGGNSNEYLHSIQQTSDGGYILGGDSHSGISGDKTEASQGLNDYWVIKLDAAGNIIWQNTIGGDDYDYLYSIEQTADGGYILGGYSHSGMSGDKTEASQGEWDYWVIKLDFAGNIVWQNAIGGADWEQLYSIQQTADGGYILGGWSGSGISGDKTEAKQGGWDFWVIKLDSAGNIVWQNSIGGDFHDGLHAIQQTADGGYILGGYSFSETSGDKTEPNQDTLSYSSTDYWVIELDAAGNILWQNTIGGVNSDEFWSLQQTADGGYILGGYSSSGISGDKTEASQGSADFWVIKLSSDLHNISGQLLTETGIPIPAATVTLSGDDTMTHITDTAGTYSFTVRPNGNYTITPTKSNDVIVNNGITASDILLMRRHILGNGALGSPYKIIAAAECNADGNTQVSINDILFTRQLILGNANSYPINRLWQFVSSDYVFPDVTNPFPFPSTRTYTNITTNQTGQDFIGIKLGDVNGSWDAGVP